MKKIHFLLGVLLLSGYTYYANAQVSNDNEDEVYKIDTRTGQQDFVPGQVLVKFKDESPVNVSRVRGMFRSASISAVDAVLKEFDVKTMDKLLPNEKPKPVSSRRRAKAFNGQDVVENDLSQLYIVKMNSFRQDSTLQLVEKLQELDVVEFAEPNYKVYMLGQVPNPSMSAAPTQQVAPRRAYSTEAMGDVICAEPSKNPLYTQQWGITKLKVNELWNKTIINRKRPVIAILDTGVDITHPDLVDNIWTNQAEAEGEANYDNDGNGFKSDIHGWDFINNSSNIRDYNSHGTHVAGIAAAADNGIGIVGANPQALIMPITVMQSDGSGDVATVAKGVDYAVANGATIINMSLGTYANSIVLRIALAKAYQSAVLVASAGNDGIGIYPECGHETFRPMFPAAYSFVLGVQATTQSGNLASFSNFDCDGPTFSETGKDVWNTDDGGVNYEYAAPGFNVISSTPKGGYKNFSGTSMSAPLVSGAISSLKMIKSYDNQEILWGDLIYSTDFASAFNVSERPAMLDLVSISLDDTTEGGNGDGMPDAGETILLYPKIKTTWGYAKNIKMNISVGEYDDESLINILTNNVDFGLNLSSYAKATSKNPIKIKIADDVANSRHIRLLLTVTCDDSQKDISYEFPIVVNNIIKIGGVVSSDLVLTAEKEYLVSSNLAVAEGATLTIEPGTTLRFSPGKGIASSGNLIIKGTPEKTITMICQEGNWEFIKGKDSPKDTIEYCRLVNASPNGGGTYNGYPAFRNCIFENCRMEYAIMGYNTYYEKCNFIYNDFSQGFHWVYGIDENKYHLNKCNIINNPLSQDFLPNYYDIRNCNYFNNVCKSGFVLDANGGPGIIINPSPSYLGTSREDIANTFIWDIDYNRGYAQVDLSNILKVPVNDAHGVVWKVLVDGTDPQDEYEMMPSLGVGRHRFDVYFNRPMNKSKVPQISFGVREPFTQHVVSENGLWNSDGTVYTAFVTITGKTQSDGINRIHIYGAEDNEFFEVPYEKTRFNINIQSAGSMATGFAAEAKMGRVDLTWNNEENDFEDAMGFNIYRYQLDNDGNEVNQVRLNQEIVDIETAEYTDYDVTPGDTYYYMYKVLSTDLQEFDASNVVAATPLTSELGDANGSGEVDVNDVVTTVNYVVGEQPKPFIFEAADMNKDLSIDVLDVIGIVQKVLNPAAARAMAVAEETAVYTVEDGVLYIETPVTLGGLQIQASLMNNERMNSEQFAAAADMKGFEIASGWLTESDYRMLAYSFGSKVLEPGKHAILTIGDANLTSLRLSDPLGNRVNVVAGEATAVKDAMGSKVMNTKGVWNLNGQKVSGNDTNLRKGVYIINGEKVIK